MYSTYVFYICILHTYMYLYTRVCLRYRQLNLFYLTILIKHISKEDTRYATNSAVQFSGYFDYTWAQKVEICI
jgi:hypothetical protein